MTDRPPPTPCACFEGITYKELGQTLKNIQEMTPEYLQGDSDKLGRVICSIVWLSKRRGKSVEEYEKEFGTIPEKSSGGFPFD